MNGIKQMHDHLMEMDSAYAEINEPVFAAIIGKFILLIAGCPGGTNCTCF